MSRQVRDFVNNNNITKVTQGQDTYVPNVHYPHIHIGRRFVVYSQRARSHSYLLEGDSVFVERTQAALEGSESEDVQRVCQYIIDELA